MQPTAERVLQAATLLFARQGFAATSIRDIASEAGVTTATLYHYMSSKEELLLAIMKGGMDRLLSNAREILPILQAPEQKLAALVQLHVWHHGTRLLSALVGDTELRALTIETRAEIMQLRDEYERYWRDVLASGASLGVFTIEDPKLTGFALLGMCTSVAHWYSPNGPLSIGDVGINFANMALVLVRAERNGKQLRVTDLELLSLTCFPSVDVSEHAEVAG